MKWLVKWLVKVACVYDALKCFFFCGVRLLSWHLLSLKGNFFHKQKIRRTTTIKNPGHQNLEF